MFGAGQGRVGDWAATGDRDGTGANDATGHGTRTGHDRGQGWDMTKDRGVAGESPRTWQDRGGTGNIGRKQQRPARAIPTVVFITLIVRAVIAKPWDV